MSAKFYIMHNGTGHATEAESAREDEGEGEYVGEGEYEGAEGAEEDEGDEGEYEGEYEGEDEGASGASGAEDSTFNLGVLHRFYLNAIGYFSSRPPTNPAWTLSTPHPLALSGVGIPPTNAGAAAQLKSLLLHPHTPHFLFYTVLLTLETILWGNTIIFHNPPSLSLNIRFHKCYTRFNHITKQPHHPHIILS